MARKCECGYECRLPGETQMLDKYGCARAIEVRQQPFNNIQVTTCSGDGEPPYLEIDDGQAFADQFKQKYNKPDGNK